MRKSTLAIGVSAALAAQAFLSPNDAAAANRPRTAATHPSPVQAHFRQINGGVLYDQSGTVGPGYVSQNFGSSTGDAYDNAGADDFVVTDANGWDVTQINAIAFPNTGGDPSTATWDVNIYPDAGGFPAAAPTCTYSTLAGVYDAGTSTASLALPTPCHLDPGTYWVSQIVNLDYGVGGELFWGQDAAGTPYFGQEPAWENPGDGFGTGCTSWDLMNTVCGGLGANMLFQVLGTVSGGGGGGCTADGICLEVTLATDNGDPAQCGTSDSADVDIGDQVNICYTVTNNSGIELDYQSLMDNVDGSIFSLVNTPIAAGDSYQYNRIVTAGASETITSTWTSQDVPPGYLATPTSGGGGGVPPGDCIFGSGFDGPSGDCGGGSGGGSFIDITGSGTPTSLSDDGTLGVTMPFSFNFYGATTNQLCIGNNGGIIVGVSSCSLTYNNNAAGDLPVAGLGAAILPLWDDFTDSSGNVYYATVGSAPNRQFVVEWSDRVHFGSSPTDPATFEVIINEADGKVQFEYADVDYTNSGDSLSGDPGDCSDGVCATIGLQADDATANEFSFLTDSISSDSGIDWTATSPQTFTSDDTVNLHVGAPVIDVSPNPLAGSAPAGGTGTATLNIGNTGDRDLDWTTDEAGPASHFPPPGTRFVMATADPSTISKSAFAPADHSRAKPHQHQGNNLLGAVQVPSFGENADFSSAATFVSFDAAAPTTLNEISAEGDRWAGGTFINNDFSTEYVLDSTGGFESVDTATGAATVIADTGLADTGRALAWDSTTGTLYGVAYDGGFGTNLLEIDPATGATTVVAPVTGVGASGYTLIFGLAVDPNGLMYGVEIVSSTLVAIDKTTGNASTIGSLGYTTRYGQGLAFDPSTSPATLYLGSIDFNTNTQNMYTVDPNTGLASLISPVGNGNTLQLSAFAIAVPSGPCGQPQDLPWVSLNPTSGTTVAGGSDPVTVTFDATGQADGDVLDGTICVHSNDPANATVAVPVELTVGSGGGGGNVIDSGPLDISIPADTTGLYVNWIDGCTETSVDATCPGGGSEANGYDWSAFGSSTLNFYFGLDVTDADAGCVATGSQCDVMVSGDTIGSGSNFNTGTSVGAAAFAAGGTFFTGFKFTDEASGATFYGYAKITTTAPGGVPATLNEYWYDNTGAAITIQ
jgi:hypothetical protein